MPLYFVLYVTVFFENR